MKFRNIIKSLLVEASPDEIYKKYYSDIDPTTFYRIVELDPKTETSSNKIIRIGKYSKILLKLYRADQLKSEDYPKATEYLYYAYNHQVPINDNSINTLSDLYNAVKNKIANSSQPLNVILSLLEKSEYELVFNDEKWVIYIPKTEKAAAYIGVNTQWCTTWGQFSLNPAHKDRTSHFSSHNKRGPLYIVINKTDENDKYQFHFETKQFMNTDDRKIDTESFFDRNQDIERFFFPALYDENATLRQYDDAIAKSGILSNKKTDILISRYISINVDQTEDANQLAQLIVNSSGNYREGPENYKDIINDNSLEDLIVTKDRIEFDLKKTGGDIGRVADLIGNYEYGKDQAWNAINEELYNDREYTDEKMLELLEEYYDKNANELIIKLGQTAKSLEMFMRFYGTDIIESDKVFEKFKDVYTDATSTELENGYQAEIDDIKKYIDVENFSGTSTIKLSKIYFILFLLKNKITAIGEGNRYEFVEDVINTYIEHYDVQTDYGDPIEHDYIYPRLEDMEGVFNNVLDDLLPKYDDSKKDECAKKKQEFLNIVGKYFNANLEFENEHVKLNIMNPWKDHFDCESGVEVYFYNKEKGSKYDGYIKVENIVKYLTNYNLFETILKIKNRL